MEFPRGDPVELTDEPLEMQILDIFIPSSDKSARILKDKGYQQEFFQDYPIYLFGSTHKGESVTVKVNDFKPYFFVKLPTTEFNLTKLKDAIMEKVSKLKGGDETEIKTVKRKEFYGFTNETEFKFIKITVKTYMMFLIVRKFIQSKKDQGFALYESNIEPFIRFLHEQNIAPSGWISINSNVCEPLDSDISRTQIAVETHYKNVKPIDVNRIAPILVASFDIECSSSHGDFPVPIKDYRKLSQDIIEATRKSTVSITNDIVKEWIISAFEQNQPNLNISRVYPKGRPKHSQIVDRVAKMVPVVVKLLKEFNNDKSDDTQSDNDDDAEIPVITQQEDVTTTEYKIREILNTVLPPLKGDSVIQIGTTVHRYGSDEIIYKHIVTLGSCDNIENVEVETVENEKDLIIVWKDFITRLDPDIITGYNIFGFDFKYVWDRAVELGVDELFSTGLGRLKERKSQLIEQRLASSALGDNILYYIETDGIVLIDLLKVLQRDEKMDSYKLDNVAKHFLGDSKNDLSPQEIFSKFYGSSSDRAEIARYCIQDCALVNRIIHKKKHLENNVGMANVCSVPLSYIFMRGQGVKIFSLVSKECRKKKYLIPVINSYEDKSEDKDKEKEGYEGAIVLEPKTGIYLDDPITVMDFSSLYPSSMISRNLSHDSIVLDDSYIEPAKEKGYTFQKIKYDIYEGIGDKKRVVGEKEIVFAQPPNNEKGIIPSILQMLLTARKNTRKKIEYQTITAVNGKQLSGLISDINENKIQIHDIETGEKIIVNKHDILETIDTYNDFEKAVLDALQNAYKVTANSLYGQTGASTSQIYCKDIAACTTATGREMIYFAKKFVEDRYGAEVIYGDTDSIFCKFKNDDIKGIDALPLAIAAGQLAAKEILEVLPKPQCLNYEKTLYPFIIFSKKRYVGNLYENDHTAKPKEKSMGIVTKRRDNAPIVKTIFGGIINILMKRQDFKESLDFLKDELENLISGRTPIEALVISKTLRSMYKNPTKIAHKVLADRMGERDPGNKPSSNERIPYIYFQQPTGSVLGLQGDRIEHPDYVKANNLKPDYRHYITNQIMKPVCQLYGLCVENLPGYSYTKEQHYWEQMEEELKSHRIYGGDDNEKKRKDKLVQMRIDEAESLLFDDILERLPDAPKKAKITGTDKRRSEAKNIISSTKEVSVFAPTLRLIVTPVLKKDAKSKQPSWRLFAELIDNKETTKPIIWSSDTIIVKQNNKVLDARVKLAMDVFQPNAAPITEDIGVIIEAEETFIKAWKIAVPHFPDILEKIQIAANEADQDKLKEYQNYARFMHITQFIGNRPYQLKALQK